MMRWIGVAVGAAALALIASASAAVAAPIEPQATTPRPHAGRASDISAQRTHHRLSYHRGYRSYDRPYRPSYYARPTYYRPYPYAVPAPFVFGFGFGPYW